MDLYTARRPPHRPGPVTRDKWALGDIGPRVRSHVRQRLSRMHTCRAASCAGDHAVPVRACCRASSRRLRCCSAECNVLHGIAHAVMRPCGCCLDRLKGLFMYFTVGSTTLSCIQKRPGERPVPRHHQKRFRSLCDVGMNRDLGANRAEKTAQARHKGREDASYGHLSTRGNHVDGSGPRLSSRSRSRAGGTPGASAAGGDEVEAQQVEARQERKADLMVAADL